MIFVESNNMNTTVANYDYGLSLSDFGGIHRIVDIMDNNNFNFNITTAIHFSVYALIVYSYLFAFKHFIITFTVSMFSNVLTKCQKWMPFTFVVSAIVVTILVIKMIRDDAIELDKSTSQMIFDLAAKDEIIIELKNKLNKNSVKLVSSYNYKESEEEDLEEEYDSEEEEYDSEEEEYDSEEDDLDDDDWTSVSTSYSSSVLSDDPNDSDYDPEEDDF
jgi:hypothetical protein